ncbi:MAG TPA: hypothetical protein VMS98_09670 [Thermoanaerobaculia bacterium]|nr:hypothetical protein [Thermoanaerobaculia bacterium]
MFDVINSVFGQATGTGSFHMRTSRSDALALNAMLIDEGFGRGTLGTAVTAFRSDRGTPAGRDVLLLGVSKGAATRADVFVQEVSGAPVRVMVEFFDAQGRSIGVQRPPDDLTAFGALALPNAIPAGAVMARVTGLAGVGRFVAEAVQFDDDSKDSWNIVDSSQWLGFSRSEPVIIPLAAALREGDRALQTDITIVNPGTTSATVRVTYFGSSRTGRPRLVRGRPDSSDARATLERAATAEESITLPPMSSSTLTDVVQRFARSSRGTGYVVVTPSNGEVVVTGRTAFTSMQRRGSIGTSTPALPLTASAAAGIAKRFVGIEDAGDQSIAVAQRGTFKSTLGLIETSGAEVTVRVTLRYSYPLMKVSALERRSRDITLKSREMVQIENLGKWVIGADRQLLSDLHNVSMDIEVVGGNGAVLPFVISTENASGDLIFQGGN